MHCGLSRGSMTSKMIPSSKTPVRNFQFSPSMTSRLGGSWYTSNHERDLKLTTQFQNHISGWSMMSKMALSSATPVRNLQCPPSMTSRMKDKWYQGSFPKTWSEKKGKGQSLVKTEIHYIIKKTSTGNSGAEFLNAPPENLNETSVLCPSSATCCLVIHSIQYH